MRTFWVFASLLATGLASGQTIIDGGPEVQETFFKNAGVAVRLVGKDSVVLTVGARSEDLQNTVGVFPYGDSSTTQFRLFESKLEAYIQERVPVYVDGRRLYFRVVQWKPQGKGPEDRLDMASLYVDNLFISLGARLPRKAKSLAVTLNFWTERPDAARTLVQYSLFQDRTLLRRLWREREKTIRFPLSPDSLKAMRKSPPPPVSREMRGDEEDEEHSDH